MAEKDSGDYIEGFTVCGDGGVQASGPHKGKRLVRLINYDYIVKMSRANVKSRSPGVRRRARLVDWYNCKYDDCVWRQAVCILSIIVCAVFSFVVLCVMFGSMCRYGDLCCVTDHPVGWGIPAGVCAVCALYIIRVNRGYKHRRDDCRPYEIYRSKSGRSEERGYDYIEDRWNRTGDMDDRCYREGDIGNSYCIMPYYIAYA